MTRANEALLVLVPVRAEEDEAWRARLRRS